jgi:hypothetical protein
MDDQLSRLISDAVDDVEPHDRLAEIRQRTQPRRSRRGWYAAGGALAAAAAVTAIALAANQAAPRADDPGPVASPTVSTTPHSDGPPPVASPAYYVGDTPQGPRLFREFHSVIDIGPGQRALRALVTPPSDPDYRTIWTNEFLTDSVSDPEAGMVFVGVTAASHDRPPGVTEAEAQLAVQQAVYTLQAVFHEQLAVQFRLGDNPIDQVFGVPTSEPLTAAPQLDVLSLVSVSNPSEGQEVTGSFVADGRASSFEGTVPWQLEDSSGAVVKAGFAQAGMDDHLVPWETEPIDVSDLEPGTYVFTAMTDDASGGEGAGPFTDTRTIVIQ